MRFLKEAPPGFTLAPFLTETNSKLCDVFVLFVFYQFFLAFFKTMCYTRMCSHKNEMQVFSARFYADGVKETLHKARLTALYAICLQISRHIAQKSLAIRLRSRQDSAREQRSVALR
ncbi:hypothetical protein [Ruminococcus sp.]